jgi:hypothetical protein
MYILDYLASYYLQEIERNVTMTEIIEQNVFDVVRSVAVAWNPTSCTVIHNCITKGSFTIGTFINEKKKYQSDSDWRELQGQLDCLSEFHIFISENGAISELSTDYYAEKM